MKKICLITFILLLLLSCSSSVFKGNEEVGADFVIIDAESFTGEKRYEINVGDSVDAKLDLSIVEGVISVKVSKGESTEHSGNYDKDWNRYGVTTFHLNEGRYSITLEGKNFSGKVKISWSSNQ